MRWLALALVCGCTANTFRSPAFVGQTVAEPTVSTVVVKCMAERHSGTDQVANALEAELRAGGDIAPLDSPERVTICGELGSDTALSTLAADWDVGGKIVGPIAQSLAKKYNAKSVLLPLVRTIDNCVAPSASGSAAGCREKRVDIGLFVYGADGVPLWRGVTRLGIPERGFDPKTLPDKAKSALSEVPAKRMGKLPVPND